MNNGEAYESLTREGLSHRDAEAELTAARKGHGQYLSWSLRRGYVVKGI